MKAKSVLAQEMWGKLKQQDKDYWFVARRLRDRTFCIERYPKPSYTRTSAQDEQRNKFKAAVNAWNALSPSEKEQWNRDAEPFGLTGYQYFIQQYLLAPPAPSEIWYRVTINNSGGSALTDYQILINIQNDEQFFNDCQDKREAIRLFDTDKSTSLSYWIEEWDTANHNAKIWVKVPSIPGSGTKIIYISVDPNRSTDESNGDAVFMLFDDFEGTSLDTSKWTVVKKGSNNAIVELDGNGNLHLAGEPNVISSGGVRSTASFTNGFMIELKHKIDDEHYADVGIGSGDIQDLDGGQSRWWHTCIGDGYSWNFQSPVSGGSTIDLSIEKCPEGADNTPLATKNQGGLTTLNEWHKLTMIYDSDGNLKWYHDGTLWLSATDTTYLNDNKNILLSQGEYSNGNGGNRYIDWIRVRKYADPEPTISYEKETS